MATIDDSDTTRRVPVAADEAGQRLDRVLAGALGDLSRSRLKRLIEDGHVRLAGPSDTDGDTGGATIAEPSYRVKPGQTFAIFVPQAQLAVPAAQAIALDILYEDSDLLVLDKPAGLVVHPAPGNAEGTLVNALLHHCGDSLSGIGGVRRPGIVHRLDKDTSGLMVVAKNDRSHADLSAQFKARSVTRAYRALAWGRPLPAAGEIEGNIGRSARNRKKMAVLARGGRVALTRYRTLRRLGAAASLIECRLATGRTHQIRVHLAHRGHPVIGDRIYGGGLTPARRAALDDGAAAAVAALDRQALHAWLLGFRHPASGGTLRFERDFPSELKRLTDLLDRI